MRFFLAGPNETGLIDTTVQPTVVSNITAPNNFTSSPAVLNDTGSDWMHAVFPGFAVVLFILYLLRQCYQAIQDPSQPAVQSDADDTASSVLLIAT